MANKLYQQMNNESNAMTDGILKQVQNLKNRMGGDPNTHIQNLLNSGRVSQAQYDAAMKRAEQFRRLLGY